MALTEHPFYLGPAGRLTAIRAPERGMPVEPDPGVTRPLANRKRRDMATARKPRPVPTFDHLKKKKARTVRDWIVIDEDDPVVAEYEAAKQAKNMAALQKEKNPDRLAQAEADLAAVAERMRDNTVEIVMRAVGQKKWTELRAKYPPTKEQLEEAQKTQQGRALAFNPDTFPPVGIAACCTQPVMTEEQVIELRDSDEWSESDYVLLIQLMMQANEQRRQVDFTF